MKFIDILDWIENKQEGDKYIFKELNSKKEIDVFVEERENCFGFEVQYPFVKFLHDQNSRFELQFPKGVIRINHFRKTKGNDFVSKKCKPYIYQSSAFNDLIFCYYKLLIPCNDPFYIVNLFEKKSDFFSIVINNKEFKISNLLTHNNKKYLKITSLSKIDFSDFKHICNSIIYGLGYLTGSLIKGKEIFIQSGCSAMCSENVDFFYREFNQSMNTSQPFTSIPIQYISFIATEGFDFESKESFIKVKEVEKLVSIISNNDKYFSSISVLLEAFKNSLISRPSILFVALEILTSAINKEMTSDVIKKETYKELGAETLKKYETIIGKKDYSLLNKVIENVDKKLVRNNVNFERAFNSLKITLSKEDKNVLMKRNSFFHGNLIENGFSIKNEDDFVQLEVEYDYLSQKLFTMISKLILKKIGYSGFIINHSKMYEKRYNPSLLKKYETPLNDNYFIKI